MLEPEQVKVCLRALKGRVRYCSLHAFEHLDRANALTELDPEMAMFRAITAEEEAATALMLSLKQLSYEGAAKLQIRSHVHKQAFIPFLYIVGRYLGSLKPMPPMRLRKIEEDGQPRLVYELQIPDGRWAQPTPPLHSLLWSADTGKPYHFERELNRFALEDAAGDIQNYLIAQANTRNKLLYASDDGIPRVTGGVLEPLAEQQKRVLLLCSLVCMLAPYKEKGVFAQQCLNAFLSFLGQLSEDEVKSIGYGFTAPFLEP